MMADYSYVDNAVLKTYALALAQGTRDSRDPRENETYDKAWKVRQAWLMAERYACLLLVSVLVVLVSEPRNPMMKHVFLDHRGANASVAARST